MSECPMEVGVQEVKAMRDAGDDFLLLDCRRPEEHEFVKIGGELFVPMQELSERVAELGEDRGKTLVVYCHHGGRSLMVARWLRGQGWSRAQSMRGGIDQWAEEIDPSLPRYG